MARNKKPTTIPVESLKHKDKRANIPTRELQDFVREDEAAPKTLLYPRDPSLDPQLVWKGKDEQDREDLAVPLVPVYIQEKIHPQALIEYLRQTALPPHAGGIEGGPVEQLNLFADFIGIKFEELIEFYRHEQNWANRMILGDSLLVMSSLAEKEGLKGKVQMIYFDPPYGIKFGSNWQVSTRKRDVKDGKAEDASRQPEQVRAFRDTWQFGIHSYLAYLRDRLLIARDLLTETGSIFIQIGDENVHLVRCVLDEVFGSVNFCSQITFRKTTGAGSPMGGTDVIASVGDYILWFAKNKDQVKYRQLYESRLGEGWVNYDYVFLPDGTYRKMTREERENWSLLDKNARVYRRDNLTSTSSTGEAALPFVFEGVSYSPLPGGWKTSRDGIARLASAKRLETYGKTLAYRRFAADFPWFRLPNLWEDTATGGYAETKSYVVQTITRVIERCLLMTTDPGDLALDPTCARKGTRVMVPLELPVDGDMAPLNPPASATPLNPHDRSPNPRRQHLCPLNPPASGAPLNPPASGGRACDVVVIAKEKCGMADPVSCTGKSPEVRTKTEGHSAPSPFPFTGRVGVGLLPIEDLKPGDWVYSHDGHPHQVARSIVRRYHGLMIGLRHHRCKDTLWVTGDHLILAQRRVRSLGPRGGWKNVPKSHFKRARTLRKEMTVPERILWSHLRENQLGVKFRRQHPVGPYIADFYSRQAALVVEVDGEIHGHREAMAHDLERDRYMRNLGLRVLRFTASEVTARPRDVIDTIADASTETVLRDDDAKQWRRADELQVGDFVYHGIELSAVPITFIDRMETLEEVYDLEVEGSHSFLTEICAIHNCGSGTTAYVAEQWGRRWITIDTSRVALALARTRLMCAKYPYYLLTDSSEGLQKEAELSGKVPPSQKTDNDIRKGFVYKRVPHVTLKSIANNPEIREGMTREEIDRAIAKYADTETLFDQPYEDPKRIRVSGPFTVESLSPHRTLGAQDSDTPISNGSYTTGSYGTGSCALGAAQFETMIIENLRKAGVQNTKRNERLSFSRLEPYAGTWIQASGEYTDTAGEAKRVAVSIGPEHGTVGPEQVKEAAKEALRGVGFDILVVCGFAFDAHAGETAKEFTPESLKKDGPTFAVTEEMRQYGKLPILLARMNPDLAMGNELLKKTGAGNLFMVFGEPDLKLHDNGDGQLIVELFGVDVYDPTTGEIRSNTTDDVACWFVDSEYNGESFFVRHAYFTGAGDPYEKLKRALQAEIDEAAWSSLYTTKSRPFAKPKTGKIAVKVINHYGDEVLKVYDV
ncbi:MAG: DUF559 domain-containing protein [Candidatus Hydrogenedentes bacterium]|nr:DUF559 domain-containing protein [Candidatus Hydrogenedentota bacterium]